MSVENALKMLKDEKIALEREAVKIERAIKALEGSGITRSRSTSNGGQTKKEKPVIVPVRDQDNESNTRRILEYVFANPGKTVKEVSEALGMSSEGYTYKRFRDIASTGAIRSEGYPKTWYPVTGD